VALALCDAALARAAGVETRGIVLGQRALVLSRRGDVESALVAFSSSIELLSDRPDARGRPLLNRGTLYLARGDVTAAASDVEAAMEAFSAAGLTTQRAKAEHNLGYALMATGDLVAVLDRMRRARDELDGLSTVIRAVGRGSHAEALLRAGRAGGGVDRAVVPRSLGRPRRPSG
jgi:tetratricopeptide (TPR) repeat protein